MHADRLPALGKARSITFFDCLNLDTHPDYRCIDSSRAPRYLDRSKTSCPCSRAKERASLHRRYARCLGAKIWRIMRCCQLSASRTSTLDGHTYDVDLETAPLRPRSPVGGQILIFGLTVILCLGADIRSGIELAIARCFHATQLSDS